MTLPGAGSSISLGQMRTEFGLSGPVSMSQMYGKGGAQTSGPISFGDMRGRSNVVFTPDGGTIAATDTYYQVTATAYCNIAAVWTFSLPAGVSANIGSGGSSTYLSLTLTSGTSGHAISRSVTIAVAATAGGVTRNFSFQISVDAG